jgi:hypothetical protein
MTSVLTSLRYFRLRLRWALDDNRISIVVFAVLLIAAGATNLGRAFSARQQAAPVVLIATPTLGLPLIDAPLAVANVATLPRAVVAFHDYQRPETATALEEGRPYSVIGRASFEWLLLEVGSGAPVWVRAGDAGLVVDAALVDYAPLPTPVPAPAPQIVVVQQQAPPAEPAPAEPAVIEQQGAPAQSDTGCTRDESGRVIKCWKSTAP